MAYRLYTAFGNPNYEGVVARGPDGRLDWTGVTRVNYDIMDGPREGPRRRCSSPRRCPINSTPALPDTLGQPMGEPVTRYFDMIRACPRHVFQVLTKRPERAAELAASGELTWPDNL
jgi:protein gp37